MTETRFPPSASVCVSEGRRTLAISGGNLAGTYELEGQEAYNAVKWALQVTISFGYLDWTIALIRHCFPRPGRLSTHRTCATLVPTRALMFTFFPVFSSLPPNLRLARFLASGDPLTMPIRRTPLSGTTTSVKSGARSQTFAPPRARLAPKYSTPPS